jgi:tetratricopeptide (TPR) repeat protein
VTLGLACLLGSPGLSAQIPDSQYRQIASALREGRVAEAERALRSALVEHPRDARALGLMGVILDSQKRFDEAEEFYKRSLKIAPRSASLLNNLGNHYLAQQRWELARDAYLKVVVIAPDHPNANLHLAQMSVAAKEGEAALRFLDHLPKEDQAAPPVQILRAKALRLAGQETAATQLLTELQERAGQDPRVAFSVGMILAEWRHYEKAASAFTRALDAQPTNFDILYNLGMASMRAGHLNRAKEVFEIALKQRPDDVDGMEGLARVYAEMGQEGQAVVLLIRATNLAPDRADLLMFLAHMTDELGFFGDAAIAYDKYLKLRPDDDVVRRERGFALARSAKIDAGLEDLRWYVEQHPDDPRGLYELGVVETLRDRDKALGRLNRAVAIDPDFLAARYARAVMHYQGGKAAEAVEDLEIVLKQEPDDVPALDALGQALVQLDRPQKAVEILRRATELSPDDAKVLMHYGRALMKAGRRDEAQAAFTRFRELGPEETRRRPYGGLIDYLNLPTSEQRAQYLTNLRRTITTRPEDPGLKVNLGRFLLSDGKTDEALDAFREVLNLTSKPEMLAACGRMLVDAGQYVLGREFFQRVMEADPSSSAVRLDLAIALFHTAGPQAGLDELEKTPPADRNGDFYLLRAQILDAMDKEKEAVDALNLGLRIAATRPDLYFQAALFLIKHQRYEDAVDMLEHTSRVFPDTPELALTHAIALELLQKIDEAGKLLTEIESRWPEWSEPYLVHGTIAYYYLALSTTHATPNELEGAVKTINEAVELSPDDAYIRSLAGKIAYMRKEYDTAVEHAEAALRTWPDMIEAHQTLSAVYRARGEKDKVATQLKEILRIKQETRDADQAPPFPTGDLLFTVRPPVRPPAGF